MAVGAMQLRVRAQCIDQTPPPVARRGRTVERKCCVALRAAHDLMQPHQRKLGEVVIEHDVGTPFHLAVACFAPALELAGVRVFALVAAHAVLGELLGRCRGGVTGVAINLGVGAL